jgi:very-short-patch-repair endonuclease
MDRKWMTADPSEYTILKENAHNNRNNMTEAEQLFWSFVKGKALGERCLRQHVIGDYIVDFLFCQSKLVVEIDGGYHQTEKQQVIDDIRNEWLESKGYQVIRFTNEQVLFETNEVIHRLKGLLKSPLNRGDLGGSSL